MKITREWAMPSMHTFTIPPIKELLKRYNVGEGWIDPFAGDFSPAEFTNDLNPGKKSMYHMTACDFVNSMNRNFTGSLFDPPYSIRQMKELYESIGLEFTQKDGQIAPHFASVKDTLMNKVDYAICCGWSSSGFGKSRGFQLVEVLLVNHGGNGHHDTIVTVEKRINPTI